MKNSQTKMLKGSEDSLTRKKKRVLFIGNSPNLLSDETQEYTWEKLLRQLLSPICQDGGIDQDKMQKLPFFIIAEFINNIWKQENKSKSSIEKKYLEMRNALIQMEAGNLHKILAKLFELGVYDEILTTNYDYCFEKALRIPFNYNTASRGCEQNLERHHGKVWHLHGEAGCPDSIVMSRETYFQSLKALPSTYKDVKPDTWLHHFLYSDVVVCGFNLRHEELLFWQALQLRLQLSPQKRRKVKVFQFVERSEGDHATNADNMRALLDSYEVESEFIHVEWNEWEHAWYAMLGKLGARAFDCEPLHQKGEISEPFRLRNPNDNIVTSESESSQNSDRCWLNIPLWKLDAASADGKKYLFDCKIRGARYVFYTDASGLKAAFLREPKASIIHDGKYTRYSFYLDYKTGKIYNKVSSSDNNAICKLEPVSSNSDFKKWKTALKTGKGKKPSKEYMTP